MNLKTAKIMVVAACILVAVCLVFCSVTRSMIFGYLAIIIAIAGTILWFIFGRCPSCGKFLGRIDDKHCPHCGEKI